LPAQWLNLRKKALCYAVSNVIEYCDITTLCKWSNENACYFGEVEANCVLALYVIVSEL
jgi:hypothetical protein